MDPLGSRHVRGLVARNRHGVSWLSGSPRQERWVAPINSTRPGEFLERKIAMRRVEELVESSMVLVLHDWELYQAAKGKR
jgi:hypothetical protein